MNLWDDGLSVAAIAREVGCPVSRVETVTHNLAENGADLWAFRARRASMKLARALANGFA